MIIPFVKYQGTGNDFVLIDARTEDPGEIDVAAICHRRFGIGADGLMLLKNRKDFDFEMIYYNSDGRLSSMCGNGGRCIARFAHSLGLGNDGHLRFLAVDGPHDAVVDSQMVALGMKDVSTWDQRSENLVIMDTGSPHYVKFSETSPAETDLISFARNIRYGNEFSDSGINVNLAHVLSRGHLSMRTYERGVEDETYSCGTGVTAAALSHAILHDASSPVRVHTPGGELEVSFLKSEHGFSNVILKGPAMEVFRGVLP